MLKRLIEVALPLKEVSEQSAREKSIRHGHISTLHIWWARRPLAACRAVVFASLVPDPDDPTCPEEFRGLVNETLKSSDFRPRNGDGSTVPDTPRNRCLEFIKHLVKWENSNSHHVVEPARKLLAAAHKLLHPDAKGEAPRVLDPFAGGGAIPLEALRLGCEAHALDINPVAHLIQLCTLVYPQKFGQPNSRPVPDYIKRLPGKKKAQKKAKGQAETPGMFDGPEDEVVADPTDLIPDVTISDAEYRKNPLAADVKYWGYWILKQARKQLDSHYPAESDGAVPVAYLWARTVTCPNPDCKASIPLVRQLWLCKKTKRRVAMRLVTDEKAKGCRFEVVEGKEIDFDPDEGTMKQGKAACPLCSTVVDGKTIRAESKAKRMGQQLMAVVGIKPKAKGKTYLNVSSHHLTAFQQSHLNYEEIREESDYVPTEAIPRSEPRRVSPPLYGLDRFVDLFNSRQLLVMATFIRLVRQVMAILAEQADVEYSKAVGTYLGVAVSRFSDFNSSLCTFNFTGGRGVKNTFARQAIPIVWDYAETAPCSVESFRQLMNSDEA